MVRVLAPTGELGYLPQEKLAEALEAGAKVITPEDMRQLRQETFMQHMVFKHEHQRPQKPRKRRSIVIGGKR